MGRRLGLIIGVNNYQDPAFKPLQFAETDARALAQWLVNARGGRWNPADVQLVLGAEATHELIETLLSQLCLHMATSEDLVFIYFASNAFIDQASGEGYLACSNTHYLRGSSGVHLLSLVGQIMAQSSAAQILCVLDCFQFGATWNMRKSTPFDFKPLLGPMLQNALQQMQGRLLYCSCRGSEISPERNEKSLGQFMYRLIMGVSGPALDPASGQVTLQRLHAFLSERLGDQQRPQVFGLEQRQVVLVGEMPSFKTGALSGGGLASAGNPTAPATGGLSFSPSASNAQVPLAGQNVPPGMGQASLATLEQNRLQQCQAMINQARQMAQMQNFQQALSIAETVLQMAPDYTDALILKGQLLGSNQQFQEALATVKHLVQIDPTNALGWSMAAALLANTNQYQEAMSAVDRSLALDPTNSETYSIKEMIREKLAEEQADSGKRSRLLAQEAPQQAEGGSFWLMAIIHIGALLLGIAGAFLELLKPGTPKIVAFAMESIALALLIVNAFRGSYRAGFTRVLLVFFFSAVTLGALAMLYLFKPAYNFLMNRIATSSILMIPLAFIVIWMAAAALLPLLAALLGWIIGAVARRRQA